MTDKTQEPGLDAAGLEAATVEDIAEYQRRLDAYTWPSFDRSVVEKLLARLRAYEAHRSGAGEPVAVPHDWIHSTLGHGESMCRHCKITNREAAVLNRLNHCNKAPALASPAKARELEELREAAAWHENNWRMERDLKVEMVDALRASEARARRMEEALRPFAKAAQTGDEGTEPDDKSGKGFCHRMSDDYVIWRPSPTVSPIRMGDLRKARAVLSDSPASAACPVCGNEERGQGGYLSCECPAPASVARPAVTDEMVEALMTALFGKYDERTNYHAWITPVWREAEQKVRAALEAALSQSAPSSATDLPAGNYVSDGYRVYPASAARPTGDSE